MNPHRGGGFIALVTAFVLAGCAFSPAPQGSAANAEGGAAPATSGTALLPKPDFLSLDQKTCPGQAPDFPTWIAQFQSYAHHQGHDAQVIAQAFADTRENPEIRDRAKAQPEFVTPIWTYMERAASGARVKKGQERLAAHGALLGEIERDFGTDAGILIGIWGIETDFGDNFGDIDVFTALGNIGYGTKRKDFACRELLAALTIVERGHIPPERMIGSWAGAMGHSQFLPSNYLSLGIDRDRSGDVDLWGSLPDVFASTANHLVKDGWQRGIPWGFEVKLPANFRYDEAEIDIEKPIAHWQKRGVRRIDGSPLPALPGGISILLPAGYRGPAFLITGNFRTLLKYNFSTSYALSVGMIAQRVMGGPDIRGRWPESEPPLSLAERVEMQNFLIARGYLAGEADGVIGLKTRKALRLFQHEIGWPEDGFPTSLLLAAMRKAG